MPSLIPNVESGKFSTSKKKKIPKSQELGHSAEVENFPFLLEKFHFSGKIFHSSGLPSVPKFSPNEEIGKFSTLVENSPLPKICKKKKIAELHELEHSADGENFPLLVENFPLW